MADVVADLIASDDSEMHVMSMLRGQDLRTALVDEDAVPGTDADLLAGPFAHVVVDEAQELTDAEWQMVLAPLPVAQPDHRRRPRPGPARVHRVVAGAAGAGRPAPGRGRVAERQLPHAAGRHGRGRAGHPGGGPRRQRADLDPRAPASRSCHGAASELAAVLDGWLAAHAEGVACVIGDPTFAADPRVRSLTPQLAKGLEFDLVVLVDPQRFGDGIEGAVDRYVAMTRATQQLVILTSGSHDNDVLRSS